MRAFSTTHANRVLSLLFLLNFSTVFCANELSAETTKQKRERLNSKPSETGKPHETGRAYFGATYGTVMSANVDVNGKKFTDSDADKKWIAGVFIDARMRDKVYLGVSFTALNGENVSYRGTIPEYDGRLYDFAISPKVLVFDSPKIKLRPGVALGYATVTAYDNNLELDLFSKKLFFEADILASDRFGFMIDFGLWWASGNNKNVDVSGNSFYTRIGLIFI